MVKLYHTLEFSIAQLQIAMILYHYNLRGGGKRHPVALCFNFLSFFTAFHLVQLVHKVTSISYARSLIR